MNKRQTDRIDKLNIAVAILALALVFILPQGIAPGAADNFRNVSVRANLTISNSFPVVLQIRMDQSITLTAGQNQTVWCNATVRDYDGVGDIVNVNATFFDTAATTLGAADDFNNHYRNISCTRYANTSILANYSCSFDVWYYANNATTWNCTVVVNDTADTYGNLSNVTTVAELLALNVTDVIDYGNLAVTDISPTAIEANVTNFGNVQINVSVRGYGATEGDGLAMICENSNIPIAEERFTLNSSLPWANMAQLSGSNQPFSNLTIPQRTNDTDGGETFNNTYWRIRVPAAQNPSGVCNGTIIFQAEVS